MENLTSIGLVLLFALGVPMIAAFSYVGWKMYMKSKGEKVKNTSMLLCGIIGVILLIGTVFIPFGLVQVDNGEIAVVKRMGVVEGTRTEGLHFRNILTTQFVIYDARVQAMHSRVNGHTHDGQAVTIELVVHFNIRRSNVIEINTYFGTLDMLKERIDIVGDVAVREAISAHTAMELIQERQKISDYVFDKSLIGFEAFFIDVTHILINDIEFTAEFEDMIEQTMLMQQRLEIARIEMERDLELAENRVRIAEQEALERLAIAQGDADALFALAEAEARALEAMAHAEAEALRMRTIEMARAIGVTIEITEDGVEVIDTDCPLLPQLSEFIAYMEWLASWNGQLPNIIVGDISGMIPTPPMM